MNIRSSAAAIGCIFTFLLLLSAPAQADELIFDGGPADSSGGGLRISDIGFVASAADFEVEESALVKTVVFWVVEDELFGWDNRINYYIFDNVDDTPSGFPMPDSVPLIQGIGVNPSKIPDAVVGFRYSFELAEEFPVEAGKTYWLALNLPVPNPAISNTQAFWTKRDAFGSFTGARITHSSAFIAWGVYPFDLAFQLKGQIGLSVNVDIKPGDDLNAVNPRSKGVIPVAILGSVDFDATQIDLSTVTFGPGESIPVHMGHVVHANDDGFPDLMLHFGTKEADLACGDSTVSLGGKTFDGLRLKGVDSVTTVGCRQASPQ